MNLVKTVSLNHLEIEIIALLAKVTFSGQKGFNALIWLYCLATFKRWYDSE